MEGLFVDKICAVSDNFSPGMFVFSDIYLPHVS